MKFEIRNRVSGEAQYSCELSAEVANMSYFFQLGFAVKQARQLAGIWIDAAQNKGGA